MMRGLGAKMQNMVLVVLTLSLLGCGVRSGEVAQGERKSVELSADDQHIYEVVDEMPEFPGGVQALSSYLREKCSMSLETGCGDLAAGGRVIVRFVVEIDGSLSQAEVVRGVSPDLDKKALRILSAMPRWSAGRVSARAVRTRLILPMPFALYW